MAWGPPKDLDKAVAVLREVVELGITHIDTSDYYGPHMVNELIRETLHPYPAGLHIVTKVGARRGPDKSWPAAVSREDLTAAVHDNLEHLGLSALDLVNLRITDTTEAADVVKPFTVLAELQQQGLIKHLGLSNVTIEQLNAAREIAPVRSVQNFFNLAVRKDDALVDLCAEEGIAFVPFWPLGGFRPLQSDALQEVADEISHSPLQVAQAWWQPPKSVASLRREVTEADAVLLVSPANNGSISAALKNAIDWLSRPRGTAAIQGKPAALLVTGYTVDGVEEHLDRILEVAGAIVVRSKGRGLSLRLFGGRSSADVPAAHDAVAAALAALVAAARPGCLSPGWRRGWRSCCPPAPRTSLWISRRSGSGSTPSPISGSPWCPARSTRRARRCR